MKVSLPRHSAQLFLYNSLFLALQFFITLIKGASFIHALPLPKTVYLDFFTLIGIQIGLYLGLTLFQTALLWGLIQRRSKNIAHRHDVLIIWGMTCLTLLTVNAYFFPLSTFSSVFITLFPERLLQIFMGFSLFLLSLFLLNTLIQIPKKMSLPLLAFVGATQLHWQTPPLPPSDAQRPNVILIGVDSLSPNRINPTDTPNLAQFIQDSVLFTDTISPLARTYPAWASILTGLYPHHHGARYNLISKPVVHHQQSVAWDLKKAGFFTVFATDDRRFNNLDKEFGFDEIIGPKLGVNDFLIGNFNDFPLSNLLINTPLSRWLFPYNHMNRANYIAYYPSGFQHQLQTQLKKHHTQSPLFLAVHFTLPHWPYAFASSSPLELKDEYAVENREHLYTLALQTADKQVGQLLHFLESHDYLKESLLILLSDHGEVLYRAGSRQTSLSTYQGKTKSRLADYFKTQTSTDLDKSAGHGSDLLSLDQYHCLLAMKQFKAGKNIIPSKQIKTRVALIDLAPTLYDYLNLEIPSTTDGSSLYPTLHKKTLPPERAFILESGMLPNQFLTKQKAQSLAAELFEVTREGLLQLQPQALPKLDSLKLYGLIQNNWLLALYPSQTGYIPVIMRLNDTAWTDSLDDDFGQHSPGQAMLSQLQAFYPGLTFPLQESQTKHAYSVSVPNPAL